MPSIIQIPLGIAMSAQPSINTLRRRARSRAEVAAANQPDLAFLNRTDFAEISPLVVVDGNYILEGQIPRQVQKPLFPNDANGGITRDDEAEELEIRQVLACLEISSRVLDEVAHLMAASPAVKRDIHEFEQKNGVDSGPARAFVYQKQEGFDVSVDGELISFNSHTARTAAPNGNSIHVLFTPEHPRSEGLVVKARVDATVGDNRKVGVQSGGVHEFRFGLLEPWQGALIHAAICFQQQILVTADELYSTCSLNALPTGVVKVHNWHQLLESVLVEFIEAAHIVKDQDRLSGPPVGS